MLRVFKNKIKDHSPQAFAILQLSIAIVIISILATAILLNSASLVENKKTIKTLNKIDIIYKAIGNYLLANKKLPCPASLKTIISSDPANYGLSVGSDGDCSANGVYKNISSANPDLIYGMIPVKTLGLDNQMAEDGFGNKIVYMIDQKFTKNDSVSSGFGLTTIANNIIIKRNNAGSLITETSEAIFAIISYGSNKYGSFNSNSSAQNTISANSDEQNNVNDNSSTLDLAVNFDNIIIASSNVGSIFDDAVFYKTRNQLVTDFDAMNLIPCKTVTSGPDLYIVNGNNLTWPQTSYGQIAISVDSCPSCWRANVLKPTKICRDFGVWAEVVDSCIQEHGTIACP